MAKSGPFLEFITFYKSRVFLACLLCSFILFVILIFYLWRPRIALIEPNGGEKWHLGSRHHIIWDTYRVSSQSRVTIEITVDGGHAWTQIASGIPNTSRHLWKAVGAVTKHAEIRITAIPPGVVAESKSPFLIDPSQESARYQWVNVSKNTLFHPRDGAGALVFKDKMWLLGGWNAHDEAYFPKICSNEIWSSLDGETWTLEKPNTFDGRFNPGLDWEGRHSAGYAVYRNRMWIVGGDAVQGHHQFDVWNSENGKKWRHVNPNHPVPWGPRTLHHTLMFKDKIWVMGGQTRFENISGDGVKKKNMLYHDIWNTSDGVNWTRIVPKSPFWTRRGMISGSVVFNGRMYVLGGGTYHTPQHIHRTYFNDVWSSPDGVHWKRHTAAAPWKPRQYHSIAVFDDKILPAGTGGS